MIGLMLILIGVLGFVIRIAAASAHPAPSQDDSIGWHLGVCIFLFACGCIDVLIQLFT